MKTKDYETYTAIRDIPYSDSRTEFHFDKFVTDLFLPRIDTCAKDVSETRSKSGKTQKNKRPPLVLFVHGGGWRRGDKAAWRHFIKLDINFLAAFFYRLFNLYENVGVAMARRGIACAVMSYPLTKLQPPWIFFELLVSYLCSVTFLGIIFGLAYTAVLAFSVVIPCNLQILPYIQVLLGDSQATGMSFSLETLLFHLLVTNLCVLALITFQPHHYNLRLPHVLCLWTGLVLCYFILSVHNFSHTLLLFYFVTLTTSQGILVNSNLQQESQTLRDQMKALVQCLKTMRKIAGERFDADQVFLMGHSAGGHLCSLTALEGRVIHEAGIEQSCIKGVAVISGVLHVEKLDKGPIGPLYLHPTFGNDQQTWRELCPLHTLKAQPSFVPRFLIVTAERDYHLKEDAATFSEELTLRGADVETLTMRDTNHISIMCYFDSYIRGFNLANKCADFVWSNS